MSSGCTNWISFQSNKDWWNVRTVSGQDGFAPATYLKEVEPKIVQVIILSHFDNYNLCLCPIVGHLGSYLIVLLTLVLNN